MEGLKKEATRGVTSCGRTVEEGIFYVIGRLKAP